MLGMLRFAHQTPSVLISGREQAGKQANHEYEILVYESRGLVHRFFSNLAR